MIITIDTDNLNITRENRNDFENLAKFLTASVKDVHFPLVADERTAKESQLAGIMEQLEVLMTQGDKLNKEIGTLQDQLSELRQTADGLAWDAEGLIDELGDEETRNRLDELSAEYECWSNNY